MKYCNEAWFTLHNEEFNRHSFLYHFTNIEKATLILDQDALKFSKLTNLNDTLESKPKIKSNGDNPDRAAKIIEHFKKLNKKYLQLLCFSMDTDIQLNCTKGREFYDDYSGRGFALPRMWAQYADNNDGVCFVFDKDVLEKLIKKTLRANLINHEKVEYVPQFNCCDNIDLNEIEKSIMLDSDEISSVINDISFFTNNMNFVKYNYFSKLDDWQNENEYRFLALSPKDIFIENISRALVGVIVGENIKSNHKKTIQLFCKNICEIKQITFSFNGCHLTNIYDNMEELI